MKYSAEAISKEGRQIGGLFVGKRTDSVGILGDVERLSGVKERNRGKRPLAFARVGVESGVKE